MNKYNHFKNFLDDVVKEKYNVILISPHIDDAALAAGGTILYFIQKNYPVTLINIFSSCGDGKNTLSSKTFLRQSGFKSAGSLYERRILEEKEIFTNSKVRIVNLGFVDALWRKVDRPGYLRRLLGKIIPELVRVYPTYKFHILRDRIPECEAENMKKIRKVLKRLIRNNKKFIVFTTSADGRHIDHVITKKVCADLFKNNLIYWSDISYARRNFRIGSFMEANGFVCHRYAGNFEDKKNLMLKYRSQINAVYKGEFPNTDETYYLNYQKQQLFIERNNEK